MRLLMLLGCSSALISVAACERGAPAGSPPAAVAPPSEIPSRKPGLWRQTILIEEAGVVQSMTLCLDKATDAEFAWWGGAGGRKVCSRNDLQHRADGSWRFESVCTLGGGAQTSMTGTAVGDFSSKYQLKAETTTTNSPEPKLAGTRTTTIDATWLGECPAGMKPGDIELPDGRRASLQALLAPAPAKP